MDFPTILVLATFITGVIWAADHFYFARKRNLSSSPSRTDKSGKDGKKSNEPVIVEYARSFFPILLAVLIIRSFLAEPFRIPTGSMIPTLEVGDFVLVSKFSYGLRLPVTNDKFLDLGEPQRGDVVVFRYPRDTKVDYIKRVIGLPGDTISYRNKQLFINGEPAKLSYKGMNEESGASKYWEEFEGFSHMLQHMGRPSQDLSYSVPEGHYFVMGDNRDASSDSRVWGFVPEENLVGKAFLIWMNLDTGDNFINVFNWSSAYERIGTIIE